MTDNDIDRTLAEWFERDALAAVPADGLERALAGARQRKPRPAWLAGPGGHWGWAPPIAGSRFGVREFPWSTVRWSTALALIAVVGVLLSGAILIGARMLESTTLPISRLGHLAYALDGDIFVADWDGQNPVRIADGLPGGKSGCGSAGYWSEGPMWSPDGRHLAYRSPRSQVDCSRPDADTFPTVQITNPAGNLVASVPGDGWLIPWSPDSTRFATWLDLYPSTRIGIYGLDGVRQAVLPVPSSLSQQMSGDYDPIWSPDGQSLRIPVVDQDGSNAVWELPLDGSAPRRLGSDDPGSHWLSRPSPDGDRVAYIDLEGSVQPFGGALVVAAADGSRTRELSSGVSRDGPGFVWSPSGDRIAFVAGGRFDVYPADVSSLDLRLVDVASGSVTTLLPASGEGMSIIAFSPEGDRVLFSRDEPALTSPSLWSVDVDGSDVNQLVSGTTQGDWRSVSADPHPTVTASLSASIEPAPTSTPSPTARPLESASSLTQRLGHLAYALDGDIFVSDWDGQNPVRIADGLPGGKSGCGSAGYWSEGPMWSPDGRHLAYRSPRSQVDCSRPDADTFPTVIISDSTGNVVASVPGVGWLIPWSPDSTRFATWLDLYPSTRIGIYGLDGERQAVLAVPQGAELVGDIDPVWSPDGGSLLIPLANPDQSRDVWELPIDRRPPQRLATDDPWSRLLRQPSPDGRRIASIDFEEGDQETGTLVVAAIDGSQRRELVSGVNRWWGPGFVWSPSGDRIAFVAGGRFDVEPQDLSLMELRIVDVASGSVTMLVPSAHDGLVVIDFSPEGDRVLFSRDGGLWSVNADGSNLQMLASDTVLSGDWQSISIDP